MTPTGPEAAGLRLRVADDIREVPEAEWDAILRPDDLQASHRFVRTCQESGVEDARYRHLVVSDDHGTAAIATLCAFRVRLDLLAPARVRGLLGALRRAAPGLLHLDMVVCGLPVSFNQSCMRVREGLAADGPLRLVDAEAERFAREVRASLLCYKELSAEEDEAIGGSVRRLGYVRAASLPSCLLPLPFGTFGEYLGAMRAGYRRQLKATLSVREELGLRVRAVGDLGEVVDRIFPLYEQVMDRAEHQLERLNRAFFCRLGANLPEAAGLLLEDRGGQTLGGAIVLHGPTRSTFLIAGLDYARNRPSLAYENLVAGVVDQAIRRGSRELEMGQTSWTLKSRLGAVTTDRWLYLRHRSAVGQRLLRAGAPALFPRITIPERRVFRTGV